MKDSIVEPNTLVFLILTIFQFYGLGLSHQRGKAMTVQSKLHISQTALSLLRSARSASILYLLNHALKLLSIVSREVRSSAR
jgi:hypothetical protein